MEIKIEDLKVGDFFTCLAIGSDSKGLIGAVLQVGAINPPFIAYSFESGFRYSEGKTYSSLDTRIATLGRLTDDYIRVMLKKSSS